MKIKNINLNYVQYGNSKGKDLVLLHGWGQNILMMDPLGKKLQNDFRITILDLPGFGESSEPLKPFTLDDYVEFLKEFLKKQKIKNPILIGHSFGGRIAILYASQYKVEKLILLAAPFRKNKKTSLKVKVLKNLKKVPLLNKLENFAKKHIGSRDYKSASIVMRKILVNVVESNLENILPKIKVPTILIWGDCDMEVSLEEAKVLENEIPDSGLIVYENCSHYAYLERLNQTAIVIDNFLKGAKK